MTCTEVRRFLPGYLDGALPARFGGDARAHIGRHLQDCRACRDELQRYRELSAMMSTMSPPEPPESLSAGIRVAVAQARGTQGLRARVRRCKDRIQLVLENILEPVAVPATGGLLSALLVFVMVYQVLGPGMPLAVATADLPTSLLQPARLETLAGFQMSSLQDTPTGEHALLVEATVSAAGEAVSYRVISGQMDRAMRRDLDQVLLFSRFRPQLSFGRPQSGGRVVLSFNRINVRG